MWAPSGRCTGCGATGATVGCREERCKCNYHLSCAKAAGATFYPSKYMLACSKHAKRFRKEEEDAACAHAPHTVQRALFLHCSVPTRAMRA